jgi:hypothetical protein
MSAGNGQAMMDGGARRMDETAKKGEKEKARGNV